MLKEYIFDVSFLYTSTQQKHIIKMLNEIISLSLFIKRQVLDF